MPGDLNLVLRFSGYTIQAFGCEMHVVPAWFGIGMSYVVAIETYAVSEIPVIGKHRINSPRIPLRS